MERVERGHWRMGSSVLSLVVLDEVRRGRCLGRVRSVVMRLRRVRRGRAGMWGGGSSCGGVV